MDCGFLQCILNLSAWDVVLRLGAGLFIGFTFGLAGIGSVLVMPTLTQLFGFPVSLAVPTANFYSVIVRAHATYEHFKLDTIRRRTAFWFLVGGVPCDIAITAILRLNHLHQWVATTTLETVLRYLVVAVMVGAGLTIVVNFFLNRHKTNDDHYKPQPTFATSRKIKAVLCGTAVGLLIGSTSVGGGVLVIPMLSTMFALSPINTVGTSLGISIVLAMVSAVSYFVGNSDVPYALSLTTALLMFVGSIPGVRLGSRLAVKIPPKLLYVIIMAVILLAIGSMLCGPA